MPAATRKAVHIWAAEEFIVARTSLEPAVAGDTVQNVGAGTAEQGLPHRWIRAANEVNPDALEAEFALTPRELTVLAMLTRALPAKAIASQLRLSTRTIHKHIENLYRKLGATERIGAIRNAQTASGNVHP